MGIPVSAPMRRGAASRGRAEALDFEAFFRQEQGRLLRALVVVTRDAYQAEELTQESFVRVWERWDRVSSMQDPTGYVFRVALNRHFQVHRRAVRAARRCLTIEPGPDPLDAVESRDILARALLELPARQRAALVATEFLGMDSVAAANAMGIRPGTVRRLTSQARARLASNTPGGLGEKRREGWSEQDS